MAETKTSTRTGTAGGTPKIRPLRPEDLSAVVEIDRPWIGRSRQGFFEKRLRAVQRTPESYVTLGVEADGKLTGYAIARFGRGEFGGDTLTAAIDAIGVDKRKQGWGLGRTLMAALERDLIKAGVKTVFSQTDWDNRELLDFFAAAGFSLAPRALLERGIATGDGRAGFDGQDNPFEITERSAELDFSDPGGDDYLSLARDRIPVRSLTEDDYEDVVDIDRRVTGIDRKGYFQRLVIRALAESGVRVSLAATLDNRVVGFIMARVDYGEFGRTEPVAVMDTIGVHPDYQHHEIGSALMSQLLMNLSTLMIDRVRTVVRWDGFDLQRFLARTGFAPSQRLALWRQLS